MMTLVQLTASRFYGGPERQMVGLARQIRPNIRTMFLSFREGGNCGEFLEAARREGFDAHPLTYDTPRLIKAVSELTRQLQDCNADIICTHGYKSDVVGLFAARRLGLPIVAVSHGWTRESFRVRCYEALGRLCLRHMDRVVCVSEGQASKVRRAGITPEKILVIRDAISTERFDQPDTEYGDRMRKFFKESGPPGRVVGAAGRLSPEKGFSDLIEAARLVGRVDPSIRFVLFGGGRLREDLEARIAAGGLRDSFILAGFRTDLDRFLSHLDVFVQSSYTEGLPNVVLEAFAAEVPVVATAVGGTPEVVEDGVNGYLVPSGSPATLACRILDILSNEERRRDMGQRGRIRVGAEFTFENQGVQYSQLFNTLIDGSSRFLAESTPLELP